MKTLSDKLRISAKRIERGAPELVRQMTEEATTYFKVNVWRGEGYDVNPGGRWKPRKKPKPKRLMTDTGRLRKSIKGNSRGKIGIVSTDVPYGRYHNDGAGKLPQRKFMGESRILNRKFRKRINKFIQRSLEK
jgi:phage gpG-like protein